MGSKRIIMNVHYYQLKKAPDFYHAFDSNELTAWGCKWRKQDTGLGYHWFAQGQPSIAMGYSYEWEYSYCA